MFSKTSGSLFRMGVSPTPFHSQAAAYAYSASFRWASPSDVWYSTRKWPPHDSFRWSAS